MSVKNLGVSVTPLPPDPYFNSFDNCQLKVTSNGKMMKWQACFYSEGLFFLTPPHRDFITNIGEVEKEGKKISHVPKRVVKKKKKKKKKKNVHGIGMTYFLDEGSNQGLRSKAGRRIVSTKLGNFFHIWSQSRKE